MRCIKLILWGLLISSALLNAQTDFRPGYIINLEGDTVVGKIDYRGDLLMCSECTFKDDNNNIEQYAPNDITAYRFFNSKYYVSREVDSQIFFLEYLIKGQVNIYYLRDELGDHYYIDKDSVKLTEIRYNEEIKNIDNKLMLYRSQNHIGLLTYYMQDAPGIQERIKRIKKPEHQNLIKLANEYHNAICTDNECVIFERKVPLFKIAVEPIIRTITYSGESSLIEYGANLYIWAPRTSEKVFLKTGMTKHTQTLNGKDFEITKIPLQLQYIYRAHRIQPWVSGGYSIYSYEPYDNTRYIAHLLCASAGINVKITNNISLTTAYNREYSTLARKLVNKTKAMDLLSYSFDAGIRIDF